ncbi:minor tail protein [Gordonia phage Tarzan]|uniref:Minor tail protein n=1 Tax=Gordonia phage Tarzan TaxID=3038367 RepID=A0AAF0GJA3_9CAUD|nr:minor tail protein [Gordonia phage Tarzan]WGH20061.1 minor tail protein [Gordonia phage Tarzan]
MPNRLWDDFRTPDIDGTVGGTVTITAPTIRGAGAQTLTDASSDAQIVDGEFEFLNLPDGPYKVKLAIEVEDPVTGVARSNQTKYYTIHVAAEGDQRFRDLIEANIEYPPPVVSEAVAARQGAEAARDEAAEILEQLDSTAATAATAAVTADIAGRDLVQRTDPGIPVSKALSDEYFQALLGTRDELVWAVKSDGTVEISIAKIAGGRIQNVPAEGLSWVAEIDASGRIPEVCLDHAGQVPAWVLARWAARMGLTGSDPAVSSWPLDIVILAGQSNATPRSTLAATIEPSTDSVVEWTGSGFTPASGVPWLGSGFARDYAAMHGRPRRRRVAIVKAALGSTGFSSLDPGTWDRTVTTGATAYLYPEMIAKAQAALAAAPAGSQIVAMLWSQGEQDRGIAATTYQAKLDDLIAQTRIDLGISDLPVIIGSVSPDWIKYLESQSSPDYRGTAINNILEDTPRRVQRTAFVPGPASMSEPETGIHWTPQGQALRGIAMARVGLDTARLNLPTSAPMPPQNLRVTRSGTEVVVEWDHPATRVTSYTIFVSTDLGSVWTAMTLDRPTAHKVTGSVAVGTPVWVRGTGTNEVGTSMISEEVHA